MDPTDADRLAEAEIETATSATGWRKVNAKGVHVASYNEGVRYGASVAHRRMMKLEAALQALLDAPRGDLFTASERKEVAEARAAALFLLEDNT